jgi:endonuclease/exonuclease/phosphatase family metal-dependent hydrolase
MSTAVSNETELRKATPHRRLRWIAAIVVVVAGIVGYGSIRQPTGPAEGKAFASVTASNHASVTPLAESKRFRLATFNIHGAKGTDRIVDLSRTAACLKGAQFVGLNEVHGPWLWQQDSQAAALAVLLDMPSLFAPTERRWGHYEFGNGALTTLPVRSWQRIPLSRNEAKSFRNVIRVTAMIGDAPLHILVTHLDRSRDSERVHQLQAVCEMFLSLAAPAVLMGDLNTTRDDPTLEKLLATPGVVDALDRLPIEAPDRRIDWILVRGLKCLDRGSIDTAASDHPCYWVDCELE